MTWILVSGKTAISTTRTSNLQIVQMFTLMCGLCGFQFVVVRIFYLKVEKRQLFMYM